MDPVIAEFLRQGILGVIIAGFVLGWIVPKPTVERLTRELDKKDAIIAEKDAAIRAMQRRG